MNNFYETSEHLAREIARKERELEDLKRRKCDATVREFYYHIENAAQDETWGEFLESNWTVSFMGKSVELCNFAETFNNIETLLEDYMDENEIEYNKYGGRTND